MTDEQANEQTNEHVPDPQGYFWGLPYDWRRPTLARLRARWWNPNDPRLFTPRSFGWGLVINSYWVRHPREFVQTRNTDRQPPGA